MLEYISDKDFPCSTDNLIEIDIATSEKVLNVGLSWMWKWESKQVDIQEFIHVEKFMTLIGGLIINFHGNSTLWRWIVHIRRSGMICLESINSHFRV
jgi:hypothetical protein